MLTHSAKGHYGLALPKGLLFRLRTAESSAATAFARCFSVCAAVTTSLQGNGVSQTPTFAQSPQLCLISSFQKT